MGTDAAEDDAGTTSGGPVRGRRKALRWLSVTAQVLAWILVAACAVAIAMAVLVPRIIGAEPFTVVSGSMEPSIPVGSIVVAQQTADGQVHFDDVVTYQLESGKPQTVTHRVVAVDIIDGETRYRTQGDANNALDPEPVRPEQIRGKVIYRLPYLGYIGMLVPVSVRETLLTALGVALLIYAAGQVLGAVRARRRGKASS